MLEAIGSEKSVAFNIYVASKCKALVSEIILARLDFKIFYPWNAWQPICYDMNNIRFEKVGLLTNSSLGYGSNLYVPYVFKESLYELEEESVSDQFQPKTDKLVQL